MKRSIIILQYFFNLSILTELIYLYNIELNRTLNFNAMNAGKKILILPFKSMHRTDLTNTFFPIKESSFTSFGLISKRVKEIYYQAIYEEEKEPKRWFNFLIGSGWLFNCDNWDLPDSNRLQMVAKKIRDAAQKYECTVVYLEDKYKSYFCNALADLSVEFDVGDECWMKETKNKLVIDEEKIADVFIAPSAQSLFSEIISFTNSKIHRLLLPPRFKAN